MSAYDNALVEAKAACCWSSISIMTL